MKLIPAVVAWALCWASAVYGQEGNTMGELPARLMLEGVPRVGFYPKQSTSGPEDHCLPSCIRSCLEYLGDDIYEQWFPEPDWHGVHVYVTVTSGMAFELLWAPRPWGKSPWWDVTAFAPDPLEPIRRAFASVGYGHEIILRSEFARGLGLEAGVSDDEALYRRRIMESIGQGRPVIALGVVARPGVGIVTGYDEGGDVLIGWSFFQDDPAQGGGAESEPSGYYRKRNWFADTQGIILIGDKGARPPQRDAYREALLWGLRLMRTPEVRGNASGFAAYGAWAEDLVRHGDFAGLDTAGLGGRRSTSDDAGGHIAEARCWAMAWLDGAAGIVPEAAAEMGAAGRCFGLIHDLVWRLWQTSGGGTDEERAARFAAPEMREEMRRIVLLFRDNDAQAAAHLEQALLALGVPPETIPPASAEEQAVVAAQQAREEASPGDPDSVRHQGTDGTWVEGVPALNWSGDSDCTFVGALAAALAPTLYPYSYTDLTGYSGLAFRTRWFHNPAGEETPWGALRWHPVSPHGEQPEELAALGRATGWKLRREELPADPNDVNRQRLITDAVLAVNDGRPVVVGYNTDLGVVYGYHIWSGNLFLRDYQRGDQPELRIPNEDPNLQSPFVFLDGHDEPLPEREALLDSLRIAVRNGRREPAEHFRYGLDALAAWRDDLGGYDGYTEGERELLYLCNWWSVMHLADARRAAVVFLEAHAELLGLAAQGPLIRGLDLYREEADLLARFAEEHAGFIMWWGGAAGVADWDEASRQRQQEVLGQARDLEEQALAALDEALMAEG